VGAITGGVLGAFAGALATGLVPGVGPVIAAGLLVGVLSGGAAGVAAGRILGALVSLGGSEEEARHHAQAFEAGRTLGVVQSRARNAEALAILHQASRE